MKISNYMNNANPIMEANANKVQKENSQTNEKNTVGQSVKLSISNEGLEYYRKCIQQSGQEKYDDVVQRKELLASKKISDIDYSYIVKEHENGERQVSYALLEAACKKALSYTSSPSYKSIKNILVTGSVKPESETTESKTTHKAHGITRGADYYRR